MSHDTTSAANPLYDALLAPRARDDAPFLLAADGAEISYRAALADARAIAASLRAMGVKPGDRVAVQAPKRPEVLATYMACLTIGAVYMPLNTAYTAAELSYFLNDAEPAVFICDPRSAEALGPIAAAAGARLVTLGAEGPFELLDAAPAGAAEAGAAPHPCGPEALAAILYTSGTTGRAKGAMLSHGNLLSNALTLAEAWRFTRADRLIHALPIFHTHGLFVASNITLAAGSSMVFLPKFDLTEILGAMPEATVMMGVPTFYTRLLDCPDFTAESAKNIRLFVSGSAPLLAETHQAFEQRTGHRILERYGMTETNMIASNPYEGERRPGAVGAALPGVSVRVADPDTGAPAPVGQIGSIEVRGPNVFQGYWRMPEKTKAEFRQDGFFITGDLGRLDAGGVLEIVGRGKDLIISGGFNVYPKEVETEIDGYDGVKESAVIGAPHPDFGEAVVAVLTVEPGHEVSPDALTAHLRERLAAYKAPKKIFIVPEIPKNAMGKIQKNALRKTYETLFA